MTLVQLRHLIALAESGSFSRAADLTHLTQPAPPRGIKTLEGELGVLLFDRVGRRAELTPMGRETLERARRLVLDVCELGERGQAVARGQVGKLRVGLGSGPGAMLIRRCCPRWRRSACNGALRWRAAPSWCGRGTRWRAGAR